MVAALWLLASGILIYNDYKVVGVVLAATLAVFSLFNWYQLFRLGRTLDFDAKTRSGRPIHIKTYLIWGIAAFAVSAVGVLTE